MRKIPLSQGKEAIVDDEDYELLSKYKWCAWNPHGVFYAIRNDYSGGKKMVIRMHRQIMGINAPSIVVDHINHDGLDNRRINLRACSHTQNACNKKINKNNTSGYKGVTWHKGSNRWYAKIKVNQKTIHLGQSKTREGAAALYEEGAKKYHGDFACLG